MDASAASLRSRFAILGVLFFTFVFGVIEVSRALYLWNTMTEVTRRAARAAAVSNFSSGAEKDSSAHVRDVRR